jgi:hypothetical protein
MLPLLKWMPPIAVVVLMTGPGAAATPYDALLGRVPDNANIMLVLDNEALQKSPLAVREEWAKKYKTSALGGLFGAPPHVQKVVMAAQVNHATLENEWEVAICKLRYDFNLKEIRESVKGVRDSIGGREVVLTPQNSFLVPFPGSQLGMMRPANRQAVGRWLRTSAGDRAKLSPYLRESLKRMPADAQAQIAFDLIDVCDLEGLRQRLKKSKALAGSDIDIETAAKLFCGMRGMTLSLRVNNTITGELRIEFEELPTFLAPVAKPLVEEALAGMGATIEDIDNWESRIDGNAIVLRGNLSTASVRKIVSPLFKPMPVVIGEKDGADRPILDSAGTATVRYFNAVNTLLNDLKTTKTKNLTDRSFWYKQFADKIDALPVLHVDDELLKYGAAVSTTLRSLANLAINSSMQKKAIAGNTYEYQVVLPWSNYYYLYGPGWNYGYAMPMVGTYSNYGLAQSLIARVGNTEAAIRNETWKNIETATVEIRHKMTQKYQTEFK